MATHKSSARAPRPLGAGASLFGGLKSRRQTLVACSGIIDMLWPGSRWRDCPPEYGPYTMIYNRFNRCDTHCKVLSQSSDQHAFQGDGPSGASGNIGSKLSPAAWAAAKGAA
jgi:hypothetical protein